MKPSHCITLLSVVGAALLCLAPRATGFAQSYTIRPTCNPTGPCKPNTLGYGYNDTNWRQWPVQPRPEETNPKTIGGIRIPTPPPIVEKPLPHEELVPAKPPITGGTTETGPLPSGSGSTATPSPSTIEGGPPLGPRAPSLDLVPGGLDLLPKTDNAPKGDGGGILPPTQTKDLPLPKGPVAPPLTPPSGTPAVEPPKTPEKEVPLLQLPDLTPTPRPSAAPSPGPMPDEPTPAKPIKNSSLSRPRQDAVAAKATAIPDDLPMRANWNASLEPEAMGENRLRSASFEQQMSETGNPLRRALGGYCPVQLQENNHWVAGNPDFQMSYQGQVFHFSSEAARERFEAAPEKYAPAHSGNDVVLAVEENRTVPGSVNHSAVWQDRLYLFSSPASLARFQKDPARYTNRQRQAPLQVPANSLGSD